MDIIAFAKSEASDYVASLIREKNVQLDHIKWSNDHWGCSLENGIGKIYYCDDPYPKECLFHELLHLHLQCKGIKIGVIGFEDESVPKEWNNPIFPTAFDNEFQHWKMITDFSNSFDEKKFYSTRENPKLESLHEQVSNVKTEMEAVISLLTVIAPGGILTAEIRSALKLELSRSMPEFGPKIQRIESAFDNWKEPSSTDPIFAARSILQIIFEDLAPFRPFFNFRGQQPNLVFPE